MSFWKIANKCRQTDPDKSGVTRMGKDSPAGLVGAIAEIARGRRSRWPKITGGTKTLVQFLLD